MQQQVARSRVFAEVTREDRSVRQDYVRAFSTEAQEFANVMGDTLALWSDAYASIQHDEKKKKVLALVYVSLSLHVASMKLFMSGHQIAAGNVMRQVVESVALTLLCASKELNVLDRFDKDAYSAKNAIRDLKKCANRLHLKKSALLALEQSQLFYSRFSHPSKMTLGTFESFEGEGIFVGAAYDPGKLKHYKVEVANRLKLAKVCPSFLQTVLRNLAAC